MKTTYFVIAVRPIKDNEDEADFIINDETLVIDAVEKCGLENLTTSEDKIKKAFPKHKIIVTHLPLLELFCLLSRIDELEAELIQDGLVAHVDSTPSRLGMAFDWEQKHNAATHSGKC